MSELITVMQRYELKYLLTAEQTELLIGRLNGHMQLDQYGRTSIASLYYDTPDHRLIRQSLEKPPFKEKMRLRSYGIATQDSPVYLELKRKAYGLVYKRRVQTTLDQVDQFFAQHSSISGGQIDREITYFRDYYTELDPACLIIYDREAYFEPNGDLRLTIDFNPRYRMEELNLTTSMEGQLLLPEGHTILEVKVQNALPLWLSAALAEYRVYKNNFSKYGEAYKRQLKYGAINR